MPKKNDLQELTEAVLKFREERDWKQFHNPKELAISLAIEAGELLEHFQWITKEQMEAHVKKKKKEIADELSDVLHHLLLMSHDLDIDLIEAFHKKMEENARKYPVEKVKGSNKKYNEY